MNAAERLDTDERDSDIVQAESDAGLQRSALLLSTSILTLQRRAEQELLAAQHALQEQANALAGSNALMHTMLESSPAGIVAVSRDGRVTTYNTKILAMWNLPAAIQQRGDFGEWCRSFAAGAHERLRVIARFRRLAQARSEAHGTVEMLDGRTLEYASSPHLQDGVTTGVVLHCRDITDRRRAAEAQNALQDQLREAQKMESIGALAGGIAHDFNNILGAILGNTVFARSTVTEAHPAAESLAAIQSAADRAARLVQQILTFSRRQRQQVQRVSLAALLEESVGLLRATIPTGIEIEVEADAYAPHVFGDPTQILQVMMNLGSNAMRAVHERTGRDGGAGCISFTVRYETFADLTASARPVGLPRERHVVLMVTDDGIGMDAAVRERMFEPFFTTRGTGGTGLGMSVVHGIVAAHEGAITVRSEVGEGTSICAYFPAATEHAPFAQDTERAPERTEAPQLDAWTTTATVTASGLSPVLSDAGDVERVSDIGTARPLHVVVVDDEPMLVSIATRLLQGAGYRVTGFTDARVALETLPAQIGEVDAVITDFNMPRISGLDVARELRAMRADLPIIISSGFLTQELESQAASQNVRVVEKTELVTTLVQVVAGVVGKG